MTIVWTPDELRRFIGDGKVVFTDRARQSLVPPEWFDHADLAPRSPPRVSDLTTVLASDRQGIIRAFKEAMLMPGTVQETSFRVPAKAGWNQHRMRFLNLLDQPGTGAMVEVVDRRQSIAEPDSIVPSQPAHRPGEVPWAHLRCDLGSTVVSADGMIEQLFGRTPEDVIGQNSLSLVHPDDLEACVSLGLIAMANLAVDHTMTHRISRPDGTVRIVRATMNITDAADGIWDLHYCDAQVALHQELLEALEQDQFVVAYQPLMDVDSGRMTGTEALVRWIHPTRGLVPPLDFIPDAEASGLIVEIGAWVLRTACCEAATWPEHLHVAVNLSARQLDDGDIVNTVADALEGSGLAPGRLVLEVTESALLGDPEKAIGFLTDLKALGVGLAIDDFGTGYSSLLYLKRMPVDVLKVDQSFVSGLGDDAGDTAIVASVISLAHAFGLHVVAEGVETAEQYQHLAILNCDYAQGYLFNKPLPADQLRQIIAGDSGRQPSPSDNGTHARSARPPMPSRQAETSQNQR